MRKRMWISISCLLVVFVAGCKGTESDGSLGNEANNNNKTMTVEAQGTQTDGADRAKQPGSSPQTSPPVAMPAPDPNKQSTIVFSMFKNDPYFETAVAAYEKEHPNTKIDLKYYVNHTSEDISGAKQEKFESTMIADFLNGKGPDLVVVDRLPVDKYVAKGLLADVGGMMRGDASIKQEEFFQNILDSLKESDGGLYALPLSFSLHTWMGDQTVLEQAAVPFDDQTWTWDEFIDVTKQLISQSKEERSGFLAFDENIVLREMVGTHYSRFVDSVNRTAHFDSDVFLRMLEQIKGMEDGKVVKYYKTQKMRSGEMGDNPVYFGNYELLTPFQYFLFAALEKELGNHSPAFYEKPKTEGQSPGGYFEPQLKIAINAKSVLQPEAWDFLKFLMSGQASAAKAWGEGDLSYAGQGYNGMFPISKKVYAAKTDKMVQEGSVQATEEDVQKLESLVAHANKPVFEGEVLGIISKESPAYFSGQKSAQAVAKIIQNKVMTYLNE